MSTAPHLPGPDAGAPGGALSGAVVELVMAAERVRAASTPAALADLTDAAAAETAVQLAGVAELAQAGAFAVVARVADSGYPQAAGFVTPATWWRAKTRLGKDTAATQVRVARRLARHYQATVTAWTEGEITNAPLLLASARSGGPSEIIATGVDKVLERTKRRISREAAAAGEPVDAAVLQATLEETRGVLETELLILAKRWGPETLRVALAHARDAADPDGASQEQMDAEQRASITVEDVGETSIITARGPLELGAKVRSILDHYRTQLFQRGADAGDRDEDGDAGEPVRAAGQQPGDIDPVTGDPITLSQKQRDAEAFETWVDATLGGGLGSNPVSERPHLDIVVTLEDLANGTGSAILARTGTPVSVATAARHACDADVRVVLVDGQYRDPQTGEVVDPPVAALLIAGAGVLDYVRSPLGPRWRAQRVSRGACSRAAPAPWRTARSITSSMPGTVDPPASRTASCFAPGTTTTSTKAAGASAPARTSTSGSPGTGSSSRHHPAAEPGPEEGPRA